MHFFNNRKHRKEIINCHCRGKLSNPQLEFRKKKHRKIDEMEEWIHW